MKYVITNQDQGLLPRASGELMGGQATLENVDERLTLAEAEMLAQELFGKGAQAQRLSGERDQNFLLDGADGSRYLLKLSNSAEDPQVTDLQTKALIHIKKTDPGLPTPALICALDGQPQRRWFSQSGMEFTVRLLTFLEGEPLNRVNAGEPLLREIGIILARLDLALSTLSHPAERHDLLWDTQHADRVRDWLWALDDAEGRELAERGLSIFETFAVPRLSLLPQQVIHNDFNPHNLLVNPSRQSISGILDLGDAVHAPRVVDLAVAAAYHVRRRGNPLDRVAAVVAGYHSWQPLLSEEFDVIVPLIVGRLAMTTVITAWRASRHPDNREYILKNVPIAWAGLKLLVDHDMDRAAEFLRGRAGRLAA